MFRGRYERLPMYANSDSVPRRRSSSSPSSLPPSPLSPKSTSLDLGHFRSPPHARIATHRSSRDHPNPQTRFSLRPRSLLAVLKIAFLVALAVIVLGLFLYEPHIELAFYSRQWVQQEIESIAPLAGCFDPARISEKYNLSEALYGQKLHEVQAGMPLRMGLDCYDFAGTVQGTGQRVSGQDSRAQFHTYWRTDLVPFGPRQEWMLKSFFATQDMAHSHLTLWSNGDLGSNKILRGYLNQYPEAFALRIVKIPELAVGTELEGRALLSQKDTRAWVDGDLIRLLLLWSHGGVWVDMDSLLTRSLDPLLEHEFVTQWDCYGGSLIYTHTLPILTVRTNKPLDKKYQPLNGALMHFRQHSPYLCEAFHIIATSKPPRPASTDWGSLLYYKLWRRLVAAAVPPFKVLPFCFSDARSCRLDNRLPDPFVPDNSRGKWTKGLGLEEGGGLDKALGQVFAVHLHNQWEKEFPAGGWVERLLLKRYDLTLAEDSREEL